MLILLCIHLTRLHLINNIQPISSQSAEKETNEKCAFSNEEEICLKGLHGHIKFNIVPYTYFFHRTFNMNSQ